MIQSLIKLTKQLIKQPSIQPSHHACQYIIARYLRKLNFHIELMRFDDTLNIWAYHNNKNFHKKDQNTTNNTYQQNSTLLFLGHTDVVPAGNIQKWSYPPFSGSIKHNLLYGRGAADMKGAIAAMLIAAKQFIKRYPDHKERLAFLITSDEEGNGKNGTKKVIELLMARKEQIDYCIVGEPSSQFQLGDIIKNGRRGSINGIITIYGTQGHVAYPKFLQNPIHLSGPIISDLINAKWDQKKNITHFPDTTLQITNIYTDIISSSNTTNITPNKIILKFNIRFNNQNSFNHIQKNMNAILSHHHLLYKIDWNLSAEPYFSNPGKLTNIIIDIIKNHTKITPQLDTSGGTSDGRFIIQTGAEILEFGALNKTIHKIDEHINLADLQLISAIYLDIMKHLLI